MRSHQCVGAKQQQCNKQLHADELEVLAEAIECNTASVTLKKGMGALMTARISRSCRRCPEATTITFATYLASRNKAHKNAA
jgi:hypothetical protein